MVCVSSLQEHISHSATYGLLIVGMMICGGASLGAHVLNPTREGSLYEKLAE